MPVRHDNWFITAVLDTYQVFRMRPPAVDVDVALVLAPLAPGE